MTVTPIVLAWPALGVADVEEILIDGQTYNFVRLSYDEIRQQIVFFNNDLQNRNLPGRIAQCSSGVDFPVGPGTGDHGIGAYCILKIDATLTTVQICNSRASRRFRVEAVDLTVASKSRLVNFVRRNCYNG